MQRENLTTLPGKTETPMSRPELVVITGDLPATARDLSEILATSGRLFDRDVPVKVVHPGDGGPPIAVRLTANSVVIEAHSLCRPIKVNQDGSATPITLPERVAKMYLDMPGEWHLPPLVGVSTAPLLTAGGDIRVADGYDPATGLWCSKVPQVKLPEQPTHNDAKNSLKLLREAFRTFPFADAARRLDPQLGVHVVALHQPVGYDESAFLAGLLTAVCRASLWLAPGFLTTAPGVSGAGSGKGLLVRAICAVAFGIRPRAFTAGGDRQELDKRIAAELMEAAPALFLDNVNGLVLRSDTLASALTERPARVRVLGESRMVQLNSAAFIAVTGNGLTISEDLARRFIACELDPQCEDPEARPFAAGFLEYIEQYRAELLVAALTIWRWGRQNSAALRPGRTLGSYEVWCQWVRDPLLALGCKDPVQRIDVAKARDPKRQRVAEVLQTWWDQHKDAIVIASELSDAVKQIADPQRRGRQFLASYLSNLAGTRAAGFVLTRQESAGKWNAATYKLEQTENSHARNTDWHRTHRPNGASATAANSGNRPDFSQLTDVAETDPDSLAGPCPPKPFLCPPTPLQSYPALHAGRSASNSLEKYGGDDSGPPMLPMGPMPDDPLLAKTGRSAENGRAEVLSQPPPASRRRRIRL